ncbi:MAG: PKD domain-containing protein [Bacteroidota bacterium]
MNRILLYCALIWAWIPALMAQQTIDQAEYFFDQDPGVGNGIPLTISAPGDSINETLSISVTGLSAGVHTLFIRTRNQNDYWSLSEGRAILVSNAFSPPIDVAEYFWDTDPGVGNGVPLPLQALGDTSTADVGIPIPPGFALGLHTLNVRVRSIDGSWSLFETKEIEVCTTYGPISAFEIDRFSDYVTLRETGQFVDSVHWDFGDGSQDTARNPNHFYAASGTYDITLRTFNACGSDTLIQSVTFGGLEAILPDRGGQNGLVTGKVEGYGFVEDSVNLVLVHSDSPMVSLVPDTVVYLDDQNLFFTLSLLGAELGDYDVVYFLNGQPFFTLPRGFRVDPLIQPEIRINMSGPSFMRLGNFGDYRLILENTGNADALMVPVVIEGIPIGEGNIIEEFELIESATFPPFQMARDTFLMNGGDPAVLDKAQIDLPLVDGGQGGVQALTFFLTRVPPGIHSFRFSANLLVDNKRIPMTAHALPPALVYTGSANPDSAVAMADCMRAILETVLDFGSLVGGDIRGCVIALAAVVDAAVAVGSGIFGGKGDLSGIKDRLTEFLGGSAHKGSPSFTDATLGVASPTMSLLQLVTSCGPLVLRLTNPGAALTEKLARLAAQNATAIKAVGGGVTALSLINNAAKAKELCFGENGAVTKLIQSIFSIDPNQKTGPGLPGDNFINNLRDLTYTIQFENLESASAAAQTVTITDTLDTSVYDLSGFRFIDYGFDTISIGVIGAKNHFVNVFDLRPGQPNFLRTEGRLDTLTGIVTWNFTTLDINTLQLTSDVFEGFLPPNMTSPEGEGYVSFSVPMRTDIQASTLIQNRASIIFDNNAPIITDVWENIYDPTPPQSQASVQDLIPGDSIFNLSWTGTDDLSGIRDYTLYASVNGGEYLPVLTHFTGSGFDMLGEVGDEYRFYTIARDSAGNLEAPPAVPDAVFTLITSLDASLDAGIKIGKPFPHPVDDRAFLPLEMKRQATVSIQLFDITGRKVDGGLRAKYYPPGDHKIPIITQNLSDGLYHFVVNVGDFQTAGLLQVWHGGN